MKRRGPLGLADEEHRDIAARALQMARQEIRGLPALLRGGHCEKAFWAMRHADYQLGRAEAHQLSIASGARPTRLLDAAERELNALAERFGVRCAVRKARR